MTNEAAGIEVGSVMNAAPSSPTSHPRPPCPALTSPARAGLLGCAGTFMPPSSTFLMLISPGSQLLALAILPVLLAWRWRPHRPLPPAVA